MTKEEIQHLSQLARIALTPEEVSALQGDITEILEYVSTITSLAGKVATEKQLGARHNVFREDVATSEPGAYREAILDEVPKRHKDYIAVKKILTQDE